MTEYTCPHDQSFADKLTQELYSKGQSKTFPADVAPRSARKLEYVDLAEQLEDLKVPPGNRLHPLSGNRQGQHAISINDQWRICFRFEGADAYEVEVCDYH
ncbi:type II toxin-antitoxin system RelE/ParE family toxin [Acidithiobacillus concretivorus]|uniref:Type II toxin-antitoxin system RelE/ParE family toxin n=1 Tax=Acidithiobacillus concretivorus TaxID=3063952 RepID=A0ABS5ZT92_9PROT|nr:type II toxin-antitoxin system RelE/ParE family toxin [Acidithiobacillus concretivorus]